MVDILKRSLAPITDEAWAEIDDTARDVLTLNLAARKAVDFEGPHGWEFSVVNLGGLNLAKKEVMGTKWGARHVLPLVETRTPFFLNQMEIDSISRGKQTADLGALEKAAKQAALFEESAIFKGFKDGGIEGILPSSTHKAISLPAKADQFPKTVGDAVKTLETAGVGGPYTLILGDKPYYSFMESSGPGYPLEQLIKNRIQGDILWSPVLDGGVLLSTRGGDFTLTVGQDLSIGYAGHDREEVELYFTESFIFRVLQPEAAVELKAKS